MEESAQNIPVTPKPNPFTTATPLSKALALILFIALPFLGFYLGMRYQEASRVSVTVPPIITRTPRIALESSPSTTPAIGVESWKTYKNYKYSFELTYPGRWNILEEDTPIIYEGDDPEIPVPYKYGRVIVSTEDNSGNIKDIAKWWNDKYIPKAGEANNKSDPEKVSIFKNKYVTELLQARLFILDGGRRYYTLVPNGPVLTLTFSDPTTEPVVNEIVNSLKFITKIQ